MMFKNIAHIGLALLLIISTTGITISKHYCGGHLKSTTLFYQSKSCCADAGCCHNKTITIQVEDDYAISFLAIDFTTAALPAIIHSTILLGDLVPFDKNSVLPRSESPPPLPTEVTLALLQTYII